MFVVSMVGGGVLLLFAVAYDLVGRFQEQRFGFATEHGAKPVGSTLDDAIDLWEGRVTVRGIDWEQVPVHDAGFSFFGSLEMLEISDIGWWSVIRGKHLRLGEALLSTSRMSIDIRPSLFIQQKGGGKLEDVEVDRFELRSSDTNVQLPERTGTALRLVALELITENIKVFIDALEGPRISLGSLLVHSKEFSGSDSSGHRWRVQ
jgi:hypothetical protein